MPPLMHIEGDRHQLLCPKPSVSFALICTGIEILSIEEIAQPCSSHVSNRTPRSQTDTITRHSLSRLAIMSPRGQFPPPTTPSWVKPILGLEKHLTKNRHLRENITGVTPTLIRMKP